MTADPVKCQHCLDPIVSARVYEDPPLDITSMEGWDRIDQPRPYRVVWVRQEDRSPFCWVPCPWEPNGCHELPHKPMPTV